VLKQLAKWFACDDALKPTAFVDKDWLREEWSKGCYTGIMPPNVLSQYGPAIRKPVGGIHWASTETATSWTGYIEGAIDRYICLLKVLIFKLFQW
jgi:monoamine oxidase